MSMKCRAEHPLSARRPGDRVISCGLPAGHGGGHMEDETEIEWPPAAREAAPAAESLDLHAIRARVPTHYDAPWRVEYLAASADNAERWIVGYATDNPLAGLVATVPDYGEDLAEFIAHARTDVPALLAEATALREQLAAAERDIRLLATARDACRKAMRDLGEKHDRLAATVERVRALAERLDADRDIVRSYVGKQIWDALDAPTVDAGTSEASSAGSVGYGPVSATDLASAAIVTGGGIASRNVDLPTVDDASSTWALPDEPGPEVTAVRARDGVRWVRAVRNAPGWRRDRGGSITVSWQTMLREAGPLTDATGEAP